MSIIQEGKKDLHDPSCNTVSFKKSGIIIGVKFYNRVPNKIRELGSFKSFKRGLKISLYNHTFYSLQECF